VSHFRFDLLQDRRLLNLWLAQGISVFGDMLTFLAIPMLRRDLPSQGRDVAYHRRCEPASAPWLLGG
jgi:hypothetical protein